MRSLTTKDLFYARGTRERGAPLVPVVLSHKRPVKILYRDTVITIPADSRGVLNRPTGRLPYTQLEDSLRAFDMELAGYGWLGGHVYIKQDAADRRRVARLAEKHMKQIVETEELREDFRQIARQLLASGSVGAEQERRFRAGWKRFVGEDL